MLWGGSMFDRMTQSFFSVQYFETYFINFDYDNFKEQYFYGEFGDYFIQYYILFSVKIDFCSLKKRIIFIY